MIDILTQATKNFCIHQIREEFIVTKDEVNGTSVFIDLSTTEGSSFRAFIDVNIMFTQKVALIMLGEEKSDDETLNDIALELANMIIGSAKVLAIQTHDKHFDISTPHFAKEKEIHHIFTTLTMGEASIQVAIKEL